MILYDTCYRPDEMRRHKNDAWLGSSAHDDSAHSRSRCDIPNSSDAAYQDLLHLPDVCEANCWYWHRRTEGSASAEELTQLQFYFSLFVPPSPADLVSNVYVAFTRARTSRLNSGFLEYSTSAPTFSFRLNSYPAAHVTA